jgi:hypothetical protein
MRYLTLLLALTGLFVASPAAAQQWIFFEDRVWGFSINFPAQPSSEAIEYQTYFEQTVPARRYFVESGGGRYELVVVYFSQFPTDAHTAISHASEAIRAKGIATYYAFDSLDGVPGQMISVTQEDGRLIQAGVYFIDQRLYIAEGSVAPGTPVPSQFSQSISVVDPEGEPIVLDPD